MDFLLSNVNQEPSIDTSGTINLQDWRLTGSLQATPHYPLKMPSGQIIEVTEQAEPPSPQILAASDDDLLWAATQGNFPNVNAELFIRGLTNEVAAIAQMLSFGSFFNEHSATIKKIVETNLKDKALATEWVQYYAESLATFPIFNTVFNQLSEKNRADIGRAYFDAYSDIKYLTPKQIEQLTLEDKITTLRLAVSRYVGNDGKLDVAIGLFGPEDHIPPEDAAVILGYTRGSTDAGRLMVCNGFIHDYTNAYNVIATWIGHCQRERIGTNESVWYKAAIDLETKHGIALAGEYVKNLRGTPIGLNYGSSSLGSVSGGFKSAYSKNQPIGL